MSLRSEVGRSMAWAAALLGGFASCASQGSHPQHEPFGVGVEVQAYPAGVIPGVQLRHRVGERDLVFARVAANITERSDFGEHDDESGSGFGGGIGYRRFLGEFSEASGVDRMAAALPTGWHFGARVDLWDLEIDWEDPGNRRGTTDILVLQPTVEAGYGWTTETSGRFELTLGVGAEINIDTEGEDVGEGAIGLIGITWTP